MRPALTPENVGIDAPGRVVAGVGVGVRLGNDDERNTFVGVTVIVAGLEGFFIRGKRHRLEDCRALGSFRAGFDVAGSGHVLVESLALQGGGLFDGAIGHGFVLLGAQDVTLARNRAENGRGTAFLLQASRTLRLDRNVARKYDRYGFLLEGVGDVQVKRSVVEENGEDGIRVTRSSGPKIVVSDNEVRGHGAPNFDLRDDDATCADTRWVGNEFVRAFPACVE